MKRPHGKAIYLIGLAATYLLSCPSDSRARSGASGNQDPVIRDGRPVTLKKLWEYTQMEGQDATQSSDLGYFARVVRASATECKVQTPFGESPVFYSAAIGEHFTRDNSGFLFTARKDGKSPYGTWFWPTNHPKPMFLSSHQAELILTSKFGIVFRETSNNDAWFYYRFGAEKPVPSRETASSPQIKSRLGAYTAASNSTNGRFYLVGYGKPHWIVDLQNGSLHSTGLSQEEVASIKGVLDDGSMVLQRDDSVRIVSGKSQREFPGRVLAVVGNEVGSVTVGSARSEFQVNGKTIYAPENARMGRENGFADVTFATVGGRLLCLSAEVHTDPANKSCLFGVLSDGKKILYAPGQPTFKYDNSERTIHHADSRQFVELDSGSDEEGFHTTWYLDTKSWEIVPHRPKRERLQADPAKAVLFEQPELAIWCARKGSSSFTMYDVFVNNTLVVTANERPFLDPRFVAGNKARFLVTDRGKGDKPRFQCYEVTIGEPSAGADGAIP